MNTGTTSAPVTTAAKTNREKLEAAKALVARLTALVAAEELNDDIDVGDEIDFNHGRGDNRRSMSGKVVGIQRVDAGPNKGLNLAVLVGEGFDAEVYKPHARDVTRNASADARRVANFDPTGGLPEADDGDPLNVA